MIKEINQLDVLLGVYATEGDTSFDVIAHALLSFVLHCYAPVQKYVLKEEPWYDAFHEEMFYRKRLDQIEQQQWYGYEYEAIDRSLYYLEGVLHSDVGLETLKQRKREYKKIPFSVRTWFYGKRRETLVQLEYLYASAGRQKIPTDVFRAKKIIDQFQQEIVTREDTKNHQVMLGADIHLLHAQYYEELSNLCKNLHAKRANVLLAVEQLLSSELHAARTVDNEVLERAIELLISIKEFEYAERIDNLIEEK